MKTFPYGGVTMVFTGVPAKWMKYILYNETATRDCMKYLTWFKNGFVVLYMFILVVGEQYWIYALWTDYTNADNIRAWEHVCAIMEIKGGKHIISGNLCWVRVKYFVCGGIKKMLLNLTDVSGDIFEACATYYLWKT